MSPEDKDRIITQYIWTLQSDQRFYLEVQEAVKHHNYGQCRKAVNEGMRRVCNVSLMCLPAEERAFLNITVWEQAGGDMTTCDDGFLLHLARATGTHINLANQHFAKIPGNEIDVRIYPEFTQDQPKEMENINMEKAFTTQHYVYGKPIDSMTESDLIAAIKKIEGEIADLKSIKAKSIKITANIAELNDSLANVVAALDKK